MSLCIFFPLIFSIKTLWGLWIHKYTNNPLYTPPITKACLLEESYLRSSDLYCHPIWYVMVSFTSSLFFSCLIYHTILHTIYCCVLVCLLFPFQESLWLLSISPAVQSCLHVFLSLWNIFFNVLPENSYHSQDGWGLSSTPTYKFHPKETQE